MFSKFLDFIQGYVRISPEIATDIEALAEIEQFEKSHQLLKDGQVCHKLYFLTEGTARTFYFLDGKDVTSWIYRDGYMITSWHSFLASKPSFEFIEALEPSIFISLTYNNLQKLYHQHPKLERWGRMIAEEQLTSLDHFYKGFMFASAKKRYQLLLDYFPDVTMRANLGHIASLLGISQETLSRIRAQRKK